MNLKTNKSKISYCALIIILALTSFAAVREYLRREDDLKRRKSALNILNQLLNDKSFVVCEIETTVKLSDIAELESNSYRYLIAGNAVSQVLVKLGASKMAPTYNDYECALALGGININFFENSFRFATPEKDFSGFALVLHGDKMALVGFVRNPHAVD